MAQTIVVNSGDHWWVDAAQVLSGIGAFAAVVLALVGIRQSRELQDERMRERRRERLEDKIHALNDDLRSWLVPEKPRES